MANEYSFNLYDDLDEAFNQPLEKDIAKHQEEKTLKLLHENIEVDKFRKLEKDFKDLQEIHLQVQKNLSAFTLTAKNEIKRWVWCSLTLMKFC
jgi:ribosome-associated translation inhibitor RaiA